MLKLEALILFLIFSVANAQEIPEIGKIYLGNMGIKDGQRVILSISDLKDGFIFIEGRAKGNEIKISYDKGKSWRSVIIKKGGFVYKFFPELGKEYNFLMFAVYGKKKSKPYRFSVYVKKDIEKEDIEKILNEMIQAYAREDLAGFMKYVSENFQGNISSFEDALEKDFRYFDDIKIYVSVSRVIKRGDYYDVCFLYNRQITSAKTGKILKDKSYSCASFVLERNQIKLIKLMAPLIFGVSEEEEVATSVNQEAIGTDVIKIDELGNISIEKQAQIMHKR